MFKINDETWKVVLVPGDNEYLRRSDGEYAVGACDDSLRTIFISTGLSTVFLKKVLCHEIAHAAMFSYNVELSLEEEEMLVDLIATYGQEIIQVTNRVFKKIKGAYY